MDKSIGEPMENHIPDGKRSKNLKMKDSLKSKGLVILFRDQMDSVFELCHRLVT